MAGPVLDRAQSNAARYPHGARLRHSRPPPNFAIVQSPTRHALIAAGAVVALIITPAIVFAHARLVRSAPAANESLSAPPNGISLWFSERPELRFTSVQLLDSTGRVVALGAPSADVDATGVVAAVTAPLGVGRYTVVWRTAAADGHPSTGKFAFTVTSAPAAPPVVTPADTAPGSVTVRIDTAARRIPNSIVQPDRPPSMPTAARWAELVAALTLIGALIVRLAVLPRADLPREAFIDASDRLRRLGHATLTLFVLATLMRVAAESTLVMEDGESRLRAMLVVVRDTRWGHGWSIGLAGAAVAIAVDVTHVLGAGGWIGGLAALLLSVFPAIASLDQAQESRAGSRVVRAYHASAVESVAIVAISALAAAWLRLPSVGALWGTAYGRILLIKFCVVLVVLAFGGYHWRTVISVEWGTGTAGKFRRSAAAELVVGAIVIAITAVLISTPLPT